MPRGRPKGALSKIIYRATPEEEEENRKLVQEMIKSGVLKVKDYKWHPKYKQKVKIHPHWVDTDEDCLGFGKVIGCEQRAHDDAHILSPLELRKHGVRGYELKNYAIPLCESCSWLHIGRNRTKWAERYRGRHDISYKEVRELREAAEKQLKEVLKDRTDLAREQLSQIKVEIVELSLDAHIKVLVDGEMVEGVLSYVDFSEFKDTPHRITLILQEADSV